MNRFFVNSVFWMSLGLGWGLSVEAQAQAAPRSIRLTLRPSMLDRPHCVAEPGAVPLPLSPTNASLEILDWKTAPQPTMHTGVYVLRLRASMRVGSLVTYGAGETFYSVEGDWKPLTSPAGSNRMLRWQSLPETQRIDAVKITVPAQLETPAHDGPTTYRAVLPFATLLSVRFAAAEPPAMVSVSSLSQPAEDDSPAPWLNHPETLTDGFIDVRRNFSTRDRGGLPTSPEAPEWILLAWPEPLSVRGFTFWKGAEEHGLGEMKIEYFTGPGHPFESGAEEDWRALPVTPTVPGQFRSHQLFLSRVAAMSTGLRLTSTGGVDRISLGELTVMTSPAELSSDSDP